MTTSQQLAERDTRDRGHGDIVGKGGEGVRRDVL